MINYKNKIIKQSSIACIIVCIADFIIMFFLGAHYPGYSQLRNSMSALGASVSPVSNEISIWWIFVGLVFIYFGVGFKHAFKENGKNAKIVSWLIMIYGLGEGIGSGVFKADHVGDSLTTSCKIHDALGGVGVTAILILPLFMKKIISKNEMPVFYRMSTIVFIIGLFTLLLFSTRIMNDKSNWFTMYEGLWQRLMLLNSYIYMVTIAVVMINKESLMLKK